MDEKECAYGLKVSTQRVNISLTAGRPYRGSRAEKTWTADDEAVFLKSAPAHLHLPLLLALWTGQRQGDLLRLPWSAYDGTHIKLRQRKTGARVVVKIRLHLRRHLTPHILANSEGCRGDLTASAHRGKGM